MPQSWALCDKKHWLKKFYICVFHDTWKIQWMGHLLFKHLALCTEKVSLGHGALQMHQKPSSHALW